MSNISDAEKIDNQDAKKSTQKGPDSDSIVLEDDIDTGDSVYQRKAHVLNGALQEIGMGRYQWYVVVDGKDGVKLTRYNQGAVRRDWVWIFCVRLATFDGTYE